MSKRSVSFDPGAPHLALRFVLAGLAFAAATATGTPAAAQEATSIQGFATARLARIAPVMRAEIEKGTMPGAVTLIARNGKLVHVEAHGFLDSAKTRPMPRDAVFRGFSMTKPVVAVAALALIEQGRLNLRDPLAQYFPEFKEMKVFIEVQDERGRTTRVAVPAKRPILIWDLFRHTAGFTYAGSAPFPELTAAYERADVESRDTDVSNEEFVNRLAAIPLAYEPGTRWEYSVATDVLGLVVEKVVGKRLDLHLAETIFGPIGMKETSFQLRPEQAGRLADAYDADPLKVELWKASRPEQDPAKRYVHGGAGMLTTAEDYFRFAQMVLNGGELDGVRILSRKSVGFMLSNHIQGLIGSPLPTTGPGYGFGLGWGVRLAEGGGYAPGSPGDAMWAGAGGTSFTVDRQEGIVGVIMTAGPSTRQHTRFLFKDLLYGALTE
ncbi:serine hydrolase domain-containing protein [Methylobacterium sp. NEAU 140]|uniref:serine hydrolase domain-containing protein n=1 Tax=Methylobacterium sp. NEAU 140 TaxID=3064945 RepID=UPI00273473E6|nr:serine hydrolase domain-containing protein [Methylobacterium sp. NEAU 140]MDP4026663.1 serine hydrolase domain-containing protein [Methylobacterium sp. NEAU 140]